MVYITMLFLFAIQNVTKNAEMQVSRPFWPLQAPVL